jgi:nucleotide-binding universal stress UspA family protein
MDRPLIVHATDLQRTSDGAFQHALRIAVAERAHLRLVHIHDRQHEAAAHLADFPHVRETLARWGLLPAGAATADVADKLGLEVSKAEATASQPEMGLGRLLAKAAPQLVVLGTRALGGLDHLRQGSFSEALARHTHAPVLFVPEGARGFVGADDGAVRLANVLFPVAAQPSPAVAVLAGLRLIDALGAAAQAHVLHVGAEGSMPQHRLDTGRPHAELVRQGPLVDTIVEVAEEVDADLIVMATQGHDSLVDALRGSTTEQVLRRAARPLLSVAVG